MGFDIAYFSASGDDDAAAAEARPGGPLGWPTVVGQRKVGWFKKKPSVEEPGPAWEGFGVRGYTNVTVEVVGALLRGVPFSTVENNARYTGTVTPEPAGPIPDDSPLVLTLTDGLQHTVAAATEDELRAVVEPWMRTEELEGDGWDHVTAEEHLSFRRQLRALSVRHQRIYCCMGV